MKKSTFVLLLFITLSLSLAAKNFSTPDFEVTLPDSYRGYVKQTDIKQDNITVKQSSFVAFDNQFGQSSSLIIEAGQQSNIDQLIEDESKRILQQNGSAIDKDCSNECQAYYLASARGSSSEHVLLVKTSSLNFMIKLITDDGKEEGESLVFDLANQIYPLQAKPK